MRFWAVTFYGFLCFVAGWSFGSLRVVDPHAYLIPQYEVEKIQQEIEELREELARLLEAVQ